MNSIRSCVVCRNKTKKGDLIRIVSKEYNGKKEAFYDETQKENARAIYVCNDKNCITKLINNILKGKVNLRIDIDKSSLINTLMKIKNEMGE